MARLCFNSTLVRLKATKIGATLQLRYEFQFHTGSIKRFSQTALCPRSHSFQFHTGSIKSASMTLLRMHA